MEKKQALNPYMKSWEYVPDGEPHVVDGRVYVYGSHDLFNGLNFCLGDYVCWSAPVDDLGNWKYHGVIFRRDQDPAAPKFKLTNGLAAPDMAVGPDGKYYLYYFMGGTKMISVAVSDTPAGKYRFLGYVKYPDGTPIGKKQEPFQFDPGIFKDDDGRLYLYTGFALTGNPILLGGQQPTHKGPMCFEIDPEDMLTVKSGPDYIGVEGDNSESSSYKGHPFLEASSMRKFGDSYYFIYSSKNSHELCYALGKSPRGPFSYGGVLVSDGDIGMPGVTDPAHARMDTGNTHGSLIEIRGKYYVFYHRHSNRKQSSRQGCAEEIRFEDGKFYQAEMTSCGLNGGPLRGRGTYPSYCVCNLYGSKGTRFLSMIKYPKAGCPYLTQDGGDREEGEDQYIANMCDGALAGFKYFDLSQTKKISVTVRGKAEGELSISLTEKGEAAALIRIASRGRQGQTFSADLALPSGEKDASGKPLISRADLYGKSALFFRFKGTGSFDFLSFTLR